MLAVIRQAMNLSENILQLLQLVQGILQQEYFLPHVEIFSTATESEQPFHPCCIKR